MAEFKNKVKKNSASPKGKGLVVSVLHEISKAAVRTKDVAALLSEVLDILHVQMNLTRGTVTLRMASATRSARGAFTE